MEVIFFAEVIHPKHPAAILVFKRGWTGINNVLVRAASFLNLDFFSAQQCKMLDGDKIDSLNFRFTSNIYYIFEVKRNKYILYI